MLRINNAFTLIELLLVVSIVIILTGSLLPGFSTYIENQSVKQAQEQLKSDLRFVQNRAISNTAALDEVAAGILPAFWGMRFITGSESYEYFITDSDASCPPTNYVLKGKSNNFSSEVELKSNYCVFFDMRDGRITKNNLTTYPLTVIVGRVDATSGCKRLYLYENGFVDGSSQDESCI